MVQFNNITMSYTVDYNVLQDVSFVVAEGGRVVLFGDEGSGKTSLLRICLGLEKNYEGSCLVFGTPARRVNFKDCVSALYISSRGAFLEGKSCLKNIMYVLKKRGKASYDSEIKVCSSLKHFGIYSYKDIKTKKLNNFNRIMLQLARASFRPKIDLICIDDIFSKLTETECSHVVKHINALLAQKKATCIIAVSSEKLIKEFDADVVRLHLGSVVKDGEAVK